VQLAQNSQPLGRTIVRFWRFSEVLPRPVGD
jgi:hypothetical protein